MKIPRIFRRSGKNLKIVYYTKSVSRWLVPPFFFRKRLLKTLSKGYSNTEKEYIKDRVDYYNKLESYVKLPENAKTIGRHSLRNNKSVYYFDTYEFTRWFPRNLKWCYIFEDVTHIPDIPSIVKSRPIAGDNQNSVLMKLDKVRHFCFLKDKKGFTDKKDKVIFRGAAHGKPHRQAFMEMYFGHPMCDLGDVSTNSINPEEWQPKVITLYEHLDYKFIMALEGNDVASNLKWVMSSNSLAVMPKPIYETWFMEGRLIPNYHYVEIKPDFSDLIERMNYYIAHPYEAQKIINNANEYVKQFQNKKREKLISLLVLDKYFKKTNHEK